MDRVCGLDVHKDSVFMCILTANGEKIEDVFGTLTPELDRLRDTLVSHGVGKVAAPVFIGFLFGAFWNAILMLNWLTLISSVNSLVVKLILKMPNGLRLFFRKS